MTNQELILGFIIVFIIYVIITLPIKQAALIIIGILAVTLYKNEKFDDRYRNVQLTQDIDTLGQEIYPQDEIAVKGISKWDNSDLVSSVVDDVSSVYYNRNEVARASRPTFYRYEDYLKRNNVNARSYNADQAMARAQGYRSDRNKRALTGQVRHTRNSYDKFFQDELYQNENREWWSNENSDLENEWRPWI